jgi:hypothetical protein
MRFKISPYCDFISPGDLFYTSPTKDSNLWAIRELKKLCFKDTKLRKNPQLLKELEFVEKSNCAMDFLIVYEITKLSSKLGYPTALFGNESGSMIASVLKISGISDDFDSADDISSNLFLEESKKRGYIHLTLAIAEPVRKRIAVRLEEKFSDLKSDDRLFCNISLPDNDFLKSIGDLAKITGVNWEDISCNNPLLLSRVNTNLSFDVESPPSFVNLKDATLDEVSRRMAYSLCNSPEENIFDKVRNFVFRDDVFKGLTNMGIDDFNAFLSARNWMDDDDKEENLALFKDLGADEDLLLAFEKLENLWSKSACLTRVTMSARLAYYKLNYPDIYKEIEG